MPYLTGRKLSEEHILELFRDLHPGSSRPEDEKISRDKWYQDGYQKFCDAKMADAVDACMQAKFGTSDGKFADGTFELKYGG